MKKTLVALSFIIVGLCCLRGIASAEDGPCEFYEPYRIEG